MARDALEQQLSLSVNYEGVITELNISTGESVAAEKVMAIVKGNDGYTISMTVDEFIDWKRFVKLVVF